MTDDFKQKERTVCAGFVLGIVGLFLRIVVFVFIYDCSIERLQNLCK